MQPRHSADLQIARQAAVEHYGSQTAIQQLSGQLPDRVKELPKVASWTIFDLQRTTAAQVGTRKVGTPIYQSCAPFPNPASFRRPLELTEDNC
jgi:hypothetical protein